MINNLDIVLENPISISNKGQLVEVEVINISLPTVQYYNLYVGVKEVVLSSMMKLQDNLNVDSVDGDEVTDDSESFPLDLFLSSGKVMELSKAVNAYLCKCAYFDELQVNEKHIKKMSIKDYNNVLERVSYFLYEN